MEVLPGDQRLGEMSPRDRDEQITSAQLADLIDAIDGAWKAGIRIDYSDPSNFRFGRESGVSISDQTISNGHEDRADNLKSLLDMLCGGAYDMADDPEIYEEELPARARLSNKMRAILSAKFKASEPELFRQLEQWFLGYGPDQPESPLVLV